MGLAERVGAYMKTKGWTTVFFPHQFCFREQDGGKDGRLVYNAPAAGLPRYKPSLLFFLKPWAWDAPFYD